jgi:hypothetical protein
MVAQGDIVSMSSSAQYVALQKYFSHPSLVICFSATPPLKLKLGQQISGGLLIPNLGQSETLSRNYVCHC